MPLARPKKRTVDEGPAPRSVRPLFAIEAYPRHIGAGIAKRGIQAEGPLGRIEACHQHPALFIAGYDQAIAGAIGGHPVRHDKAAIENEPRNLDRFLRMSDVQGD